jgi:hypothetical protein
MSFDLLSFTVWKGFTDLLNPKRYSCFAIRRK